MDGWCKLHSYSYTAESRDIAKLQKSSARSGLIQHSSSHLRRLLNRWEAQRGRLNALWGFQPTIDQRIGSVACQSVDPRTPKAVTFLIPFGDSCRQGPWPFAMFGPLSPSSSERSVFIHVPFSQQCLVGTFVGAFVHPPKKDSTAERSALCGDRSPSQTATSQTGVRRRRLPR